MTTEHPTPATPPRPTTHHRRSFRYPVESISDAKIGAVLVLSEEESVEAVIMDESTGGVGVFVGVEAPITMNMRVEVNETDSVEQFRPARVTHIVIEDVSGIQVQRVGLQWLD